ncbi:MAG: hypothetical protein O7B25_16350 [Gammaproteobacteria bacterium]|nr:hypothetical protein [Gammaproteobacteria bacterium]
MNIRTGGFMDAPPSSGEIELGSEFAGTDAIRIEMVADLAMRSSRQNLMRERSLAQA